MIGKRRWTPRRLAGMAAIGTVVVAAGVLTGASSAFGVQNIHTHVAYTCQFPSGTQQVGVDIAATFPGSGAVDQPIWSAGGTVTLTVPQAALAAFTKSNATSVAALGQFTTVVTQNGQSETATWASLIAPSTSIPATGNLILIAVSAAPAVTPKAPGDVTFDAATLTVVLTPKKADGSATSPATVPLSCTLSAGQKALLATVAVTGATAPAAPSGSLSVGPVPAYPHSSGPRGSSGIPAGCGNLPGGLTGVPGLCGYTLGYSNVTKLNGAALIGPGLANDPPAGYLRSAEYGVGKICVPPEPSGAACFAVHGKSINYTCSLVQLENDGLSEFPPARSTFLAFGFMPVTATMQLTEALWPSPPQEGAGCIDPKGYFRLPPITPPNPTINITAQITIPNFGVNSNQNIVTTVETYLSVRLYDVTVNGVPLDVGPNCQTARPVHAIQIGFGSHLTHDGGHTYVDTGYTLGLGGQIIGTIDIPPFSGCGVGENLDPLFNASVTENNNYIKLTQGALCVPDTNVQCPPVVPTPQH